MTEHIWGIDPALSHISFAFADLQTDHVEVESLITHTEEREGARLGLLDRQVRTYARQTAGRYPPAAVWVEQPSGRFPNLQLYYCVGVIQAALFETLGCPVWSMPSGRWKKATVGAGNATKDQVAEWVRGRRIEFDGQDEADAIAVALAGRAMFSERSFAAGVAA